MPHRNRKRAVDRETLFQQQVDLAERRAPRPVQGGPVNQPAATPEDAQQDSVPAEDSSEGASSAADDTDGSSSDAISASREKADTDDSRAIAQGEGSGADIHDMNGVPGCGTLSTGARRKLDNPHARRLESIVWLTKLRNPERRYVRVSELRHSPDQVREDYGDQEFEHLVRTAGRYGILQPILVRSQDPHGRYAPYVLLDGHRRLRIFEDLVRRAREWDSERGRSVPYDPEVPVETTRSLSSADAAGITFNANETALSLNSLERGRGINKLAAHLLVESGDEPTFGQLADITGKSIGAVHKYRTVALRVYPSDLERAFASCDAGGTTAAGQASTRDTRSVPQAVLRALSIDDLHQAARLRDGDEAGFRARLVVALQKAIRRADTKEHGGSSNRRSEAPDLADAPAPKAKRGTGPVDMRAIYESVVEEGGFNRFRLSRKVGEYDAAQARRWIQTGAPAIVALAERVGEPAVVVRDAGPGSVIVVRKQPAQATVEEVRAAAKALTDELRRHLDRARALGAADVVEMAKRTLGIDDESADEAA